jgi:hypothetical protein
MKKLIACLLTVSALVACDSGPEGPGDITATVRSSGPTLGAAVVEVVGTGIEGFSGAGGTQVFWAQQESPMAFRVVVVGDGSGDLTFNVTVRDRGARVPRTLIVSAVDTDNVTLPVTDDYRVGFSR